MSPAAKKSAKHRKKTSEIPDHWAKRLEWDDEKLGDWLAETWSTAFEKSDRSANGGRSDALKRRWMNNHYRLGFLDKAIDDTDQYFWHLASYLALGGDLARAGRALRQFVLTYRDRRQAYERFVAQQAALLRNGVRQLDEKIIHMEMISAIGYQIRLREVGSAMMDEPLATKIRKIALKDPQWQGKGVPAVSTIRKYFGQMGLKRALWTSAYRAAAQLAEDTVKSYSTETNEKTFVPAQPFRRDSQ